MRLFTALVLAVLYIFSAVAATTLSQNTNTQEREPIRTVSGERVSLLLFFNQLQQGRVGLIAVEAPDAVQITGQFGGRSLAFYIVEEAPTTHYGLITARLDQPIRDNYELIISVSFADGSQENLSAAVSVSSGGFIQQEVTLLPDQMNLINPDVETAELERIFALTEPVTPERMWDENSFIVPVDAPLTSPFGAVRIFNGTFNTIHTGWDFQAQIGRPMLASAAGEVVFAGPLDIRGNYVLIDHGLGIYSGYAHLSVIHVAQGQRVKASQIIGQVGSTGRSSSAHAHVEFVVNNQWVDGVDFIRLSPP